MDFSIEIFIGRSFQLDFSFWIETRKYGFEVSTEWMK